MQIHNCTIITNSDSKLEMTLEEGKNFTGNLVLTQEKFAEYQAKKAAEVADATLTPTG